MGSATGGAVGVCVAGNVAVGWANGVAVGVAVGGRVGSAAGGWAGVGWGLPAAPWEGTITGADRTGPRAGVAVWAGGASVTPVAVGVALGMAVASAGVAVGAEAAGDGVLVGAEAGVGCPAAAGWGAEDAAPGLAAATAALPAVTKGIDAALSLMTA